MKRLAQASLEVLTSYGWMLLVIAAMGGALAYFGVFDTGRNLPPQCNIGFEFSCERFNIRSDGDVNLELGNKVGVPITISKITCTYPDDTASTANLGSGVVLAPGAISPPLTCLSDGLIFNPGDGNYVQVEISMIYYKQGSSIPHPVEGTVGIETSSELP